MRRFALPARLLAAAALLLFPLAARAGQVPSLDKAMIPADMPPRVRELVEKLYDDDTGHILWAVRALGEMGPAAESAAPFLASMLPGHFSIEEANSAAIALARIGKGAGDALAVAAGSTSSDACRRAVLTLARIDAPRAAPILLDLLSGDLARDHVIGALRLTGQHGQDYTLKLLASTDAVQRRGAVRALLAYTPAHLGYHDLLGMSGGEPPARMGTKEAVELIFRFVGDADRSVRLAALQSLERICSPREAAVPLSDVLRAALKDDDAAIRLAAIAVAQAAAAADKDRFDALEPLVSDPAGEVRAAAVAALAGMAGERPRAVALLVKLLKDPAPPIREQAALALGRLRAVEAEEQLLAAVEDESLPVRIAVALALGRCGGKAGTEAVLRLTESPDARLRFEAARALSERCLDLRRVNWDNRLTLRMTGSESMWPTRVGLLPPSAAVRESFPYERVQEHMLQLLQGADADVQSVAAEALIEGARGQPPDTALMAALQSASSVARLVAFLYMEQSKMVPDARFREPLRQAARSGGDRFVTNGLAQAMLKRMGDGETVRRCAQALKDGDAKAACESVGVLAELGDVALDVLLAHLGDARPGVREAVARALAPQANRPRVQALLKSASKSADAGLRQGAEQVAALARRALAPPPLSDADLRQALARGGNGWRGLLPQMDAAAMQGAARLLHDDDATVRTAAAAALGEAKDRSAAPELVKALGDPSAGVRAQAAESLARLGDRACVPQLVERLWDPEGAVRESAAAALGRLGDPSAVEPLIQALDGPDWHLRRAAAQGLGLLGTAGVASLRQLLAQDPHWCVRGAAAEALGRAAGLPAAPALIGALEDDHWYVRQAGQAALVAATKQTLPADAEAWRAWWTRQRPDAPSTPEGGGGKPASGVR